MVVHLKSGLREFWINYFLLGNNLSPYYKSWVILVRVHKYISQFRRALARSSYTRGEIISQQKIINSKFAQPTFEVDYHSAKISLFPLGKQCQSGCFDVFFMTANTEHKNNKKTTSKYLINTIIKEHQHRWNSCGSIKPCQTTLRMFTATGEPIKHWSKKICEGIYRLISKSMKYIATSLGVHMCCIKSVICLAFFIHIYHP